jgi:hypothetical protein
MTTVLAEETMGIAMGIAMIKGQRGPYFSLMLLLDFIMNQVLML